MRRTLGGLLVALALAACSQLPTPATSQDGKAAQAASGPLLRPLDIVTPVQGANDVVVGGKVSKVPGATGNPSFYLEAKKGDGYNGAPASDGCNASPTAKTTIKLTSSDKTKIPDSQGIFQVSGCGASNAVTIPYSVLPAVEDGDVTLTATAVPGTGLGGTYTSGSFIVSIITPKPSDSTPPVVTPTVTGTEGLGGWYTSDVRVRWDVTDGESAVTTPECVTTVVDTDTGGATISCTAKSTGGTTTRSVTVKRDTAAPVISGSDLTNTIWRNTSLVSPEFTVSDATSGLTGDSPAKFTLTASAESAGADSPTTVSRTVADQAGNTATRVLSALIDKTAPTVSGSATTPPNANGWYRGDVTVAFSCSDGLSGLSGSCAETATVSTEGSSLSASRTVTDRAGNSATATVNGLKIDKTPPSISGTRNTPPNAAGWNNADVTVSFSCADTLSGQDSCPAPVTLGEGADQSARGTVTDRAGNTAAATVSGINVDKTAPTAQAERLTPANPAGWNNTDVGVKFVCNDPEGGSGCAAPSLTQTVTGEGADLGATGTVSDRAGNTSAPVTLGGIRIDRQAPTVTAGDPSGQQGENGWYLGDVSVTFSCADNLSGAASCPGTVTTTGEGSALALSSGAVRDLAGNEAAPVSGGSYKVDKTNPTIVGAPDRDPNAARWYNAAVNVSFSCTDAGSGVASCTPARTLAEGADQSVPGTVRDQAGRTASVTVSGLNIDLTAPTISAARDLPANAAGWNNSDVTVRFSCADALSGAATCSAPVTLGEGAGQSAAGTVTDRAGNPATVSVRDINIDKTAPSITASRSPSANGAGWNNGDVTVEFTCTDSLSTVAACDGSATVTAEGQDQTVTGTATDRAGNAATQKVGNINIDKSAPTIALNTRTPANPAGWNNTDVTATFTCGDSLSGMVSCDPLTLGTEGQGQSLTQTVKDRAGNSATLTVGNVNIDKTKPSFSGNLIKTLIAENASGAALKLGDLAASDSGSGLSGALSCTPLRLPLGTTPVTCAVQDQAGNSAVPYHAGVNVTLGGIYTTTFNLLAPLKNTPADLSLVKLGSVVPVKFTAPSYVGGPATDLAPGMVLKATFRNASTTDTSFEVTDQTSTGSTVWRYDAATNQYIYNLSTKAGFAAGEYDLTISYGGVVLARGAFNVKK